MARKHWRAGMGEQWRSLNRRAFARACAALVPEVTEGDLTPGRRRRTRQALARDGSLVDDFAVAEGQRMVHVLNAPSPAATASLAIGEEDRRTRDRVAVTSGRDLAHVPEREMRDHGEQKERDDSRQGRSPAGRLSGRDRSNGDGRRRRRLLPWNEDNGPTRSRRAE